MTAEKFKQSDFGHCYNKWTIVLELVGELNGIRMLQD
jgi:hypothetical protein